MAPQYIDKTGLFRDILKEAQNREDIKPDKNRILNKRKEKDPLEVKAHMIIEHTTQLQCFLAENRGKYFLCNYYTYLLLMYLLTYILRVQMQQFFRNMYTYFM